MKAIVRSEVLGLADYETVRERFRGRIMAEKRNRRVQVGPDVTVIFENRDTALLQIQEMLRTERITRTPAIEHEIDTYNELVPGNDELSCTLMIEIADKARRDAFLQAAIGLEAHVWLVTAGRRLAARSNARGEATDRTTAVHYLKFSIPEAVANTLRAVAKGGATVPSVELQIDHAAYAASSVLGPPTLIELGRDLET